VGGEEMCTVAAISTRKAVLCELGSSLRVSVRNDRGARNVPRPFLSPAAPLPRERNGR